MPTKPKTQSAAPATKAVVHRRQFTGTVARVSAAKTIAVTVIQIVTNAKYRKQYTRTAKYLVHDENNTAKAGDKVVFVECRPISKQKRWRLVEIVKA